MKKRLIGLLLILVMMLTMAACGDEGYDAAPAAQETVLEETESEGIDTEDAQAEPETEEAFEEETEAEYIIYTFRNKRLLDQHYEKHGRDMGFRSAEDYEAAACDVANDPGALHKTEAEDGDDIYYVEETNEFVVVSTDGYLRTYFLPDRGKAYFDKQ